MSYAEQFSQQPVQVMLPSGGGLAAPTQSEPVGMAGVTSLRAGAALRASVLNEDEHDVLLAVKGVKERFLVDKASGAVYVMGAAGAVATTGPREIGAWRAEDSSIVIVSPTAQSDVDDDDGDDDEEEEEDGDDSPPPLPAARANAAASVATAGSPPVLRTAPEASSILKPTARHALPSRPERTGAPVVQQPSPPPLPTVQQVAEMKLLASELGAEGAELEAARARVAALKADTSAGREKATRTPREVVFSAGALGLSLVESGGNIDERGTRLGDQYSTRVDKLNWNPDGTQGQAGRSGKVQLHDLVVSVEGKDLKGLQYDEVIAKLKLAPRPVRIGFSDVDSVARTYATTDVEPKYSADLTSQGLAERGAPKPDSTAQISAAAPEDSMAKIDSIKAEIRAAERLKDDMRHQDVHGRKAKLAVAAVERAMFAGGGDVADSGEELSSIFATGDTHTAAVHLDQTAKIDTLPSPTRFSEWESQLADQEAWVAEDEARQYRLEHHGAEADKRTLARRFEFWHATIVHRRRLAATVLIGNAIVNKRYLVQALVRWRTEVLKSNPRHAGGPRSLSPRSDVRSRSPRRAPADERAGADLTLSPERQAVASPVQFTVKATGLDPSTTLNLDWSESNCMSPQQAQNLTERTASSIGLSMVSRTGSRSPFYRGTDDVLNGLTFRSTSASSNTADGIALDVETWQAAGSAMSPTGELDPKELQRLVHLGRLGVYNEMRRQQHYSATVIQKWVRMKLAKWYVEDCRIQREQEQLDELERTFEEETDLVNWAATTIQARARGNLSRSQYWEQVQADEERLAEEIAAAAVQARWRGIQARSRQRQEVVNQAQQFMLTLKKQAEAKKLQALYAEVEGERQERLRLEEEWMKEKRKRAGLISAMTIAHNAARTQMEQQQQVVAPPTQEALAKALMEQNAAATQIQARIRGHQHRQAQADEAARSSLAGSEMTMDLSEWIAQNGGGHSEDDAALVSSLAKAGAKTPRDVLILTNDLSDFLKLVNDGGNSPLAPETEPAAGAGGGSASVSSLVLICPDGTQVQLTDSLSLGRGVFGCLADDKALSKNHSLIQKSATQFVAGYRAAFEIVPQGKNSVKIERPGVEASVIGDGAEAKTAVLQAGDVLTLGKGLSVKINPQRTFRVETNETPAQKRHRAAEKLWKQIQRSKNAEDDLIRGLQAAEKLEKAKKQQIIAPFLVGQRTAAAATDAIESIVSAPEIAEGVPPLAPLSPAEMEKSVNRIESAATVIQARFRGHIAREMYWEKVEDRIARYVLCEPVSFSCTVAFCELTALFCWDRLEADIIAGEEMEKAAITIQSRVRGQQAQQAVETRKQMEASRKLLAEEQSAAIMIQAQIRGKMSRTDSARAEAEKQAALNDTSWLDREVGQWLTQCDEASIVHAVRDVGINTLRDLVLSPL